jgi:hypothetical protein
MLDTFHMLLVAPMTDTLLPDVVISQLISSNLLRMTDGEVHSWKRREAR